MKVEPLASSWASAFCVVRFDLQLGQIVEHCVPADFFNQKERKYIASSAFPDSNTHSGDCLFTIKIPDPSNSKNWLYGYTYFRQEKDSGLVRGSEQTSIVLFTKWPFIRFFKSMVKMIAWEFYNLKPAPNSEETESKEKVSISPDLRLEQRQCKYCILDQVLDESCSWPPLHLDMKYEVTVLGKTLKLTTPYHVSDVYVDSDSCFQAWQANLSSLHSSMQSDPDPGMPLQPNPDPDMPPQPNRDPEIPSQLNADPEIPSQLNPNPDMPSQPKPAPELASQPKPAPELASQRRGPRDSPNTNTKPNPNGQINIQGSPGPQTEPQCTGPDTRSTYPHPSDTHVMNPPPNDTHVMDPHPNAPSTPPRPNGSMDNGDVDPLTKDPTNQSDGDAGLLDLSGLESTPNGRRVNSDPVPTESWIAKSIAALRTSEGSVAESFSAFAKPATTACHAREAWANDEFNHSSSNQLFASEDFSISLSTMNSGNNSLDMDVRVEDFSATEPDRVSRAADPLHLQPTHQRSASGQSTSSVYSNTPSINGYSSGTATPGSALSVSPVESSQLEFLQSLGEDSSSPRNARGRSPGMIGLPVTPLTPFTPVPGSPISRSNSADHSSNQLARLAGRCYLFSDVNIFNAFRPHLSNLWKVWELMILGKPIMILSTNPAIASETVLSAVSLILPLTYAGDFRPFFTIQDPDFHSLGNKGKSGSFDDPIIIGTTNPFFAKQYSGWKNCMTITKGSKRNGASKSPLGSNSRENVVWDFTNEFFSDHKFVASPNTEAARSMIRSLLPRTQGTEGRVTDTINDETIRRYFFCLTEDFLGPLNSCFNLLWESVKIPILLHTSGYDRVLQPHLFKDYTDKHGGEKGIFKASRKDIKSLYRQFIDSVSFSSWLKETVQENFRKELITKKPEVILAGCTEEQMIDVYMALKKAQLQETQRCITDLQLLQAIQVFLDCSEGELLPSHVVVALRKQKPLQILQYTGV